MFTGPCSERICITSALHALLVEEPLFSNAGRLKAAYSLVRLERFYTDLLCLLYVQHIKSSFTYDLNRIRSRVGHAYLPILDFMFVQRRIHARSI